MSETDLDILISRVVDGRAAAPDWNQIESHAAGDAGVWKQVALAQRDHSLLCGAVFRATAPAVRIEIPAQPSVQIPESYRIDHASVTHRSRRVAAWAGWAAAAAMALAFLGRSNVPVSGPSQEEAGLGSRITSAADALNLYLNKGQADGSVIGQEPNKQILEVQPLAGRQGYKVIFVRQIIEQAEVDNLYRFTSDELGRLSPVPVRPEPVTPAVKPFRKPAV